MMELSDKMAVARGRSKAGHPQRIDATQRAIAAMDLRMQSMTYHEIARTIGYNSPEAARIAVARLIENTKSDTCIEYREIITQRLEKQAAQLLPFTKPQKRGAIVEIPLDTIKEYRMLCMEIAKLHGCYVEVTVKTGDNIETQNIQNNLAVQFDASKMTVKQLELYAQLLASTSSPSVSSPITVIDAIPDSQNGNGTHHPGGNGTNGVVH